MLDADGRRDSGPEESEALMEAFEAAPLELSEAQAVEAVAASVARGFRRTWL